MNRVKGFLWPRATGDLFKCGRSWHLSVNKHESGLVDAETVRLFEFQPQRGGATAGTLQQDGLNYGDQDLGEIFNVSRKVLWRSKLPCCYEENDLGQKEYSMNFSRQYSSGAENHPALNRDFLVKLWVADRKMKKSKAKRKKIIPSPANRVVIVSDNLSPLQLALVKLFLGASITVEKTSDLKNPVLQKPVLKPPPPSQPVIGSLEPASLDEAQVATLLARSTLLITRDIEWANLMLGFEQENRYAIVDVCYPQSPVGLIREQSNLIARQLLRTRRPFVAYITDSLGNELFRVRRPFWWINSSIYAEINGKEVGVVHRRWHLWKRIYDLYLGNEQFAVVENPGFWNWTFSLKDIDGKLLAQIDRDWRGFGFEIFTDAGQYVIRFGSADTGSRSGPADLIQELEVVHPLTLSERAVTVALAVSLDNDYFSRHGGWGIPFFAIEE